ncbi:hypothetical protein Hanom_Chr04g00353551 [Helianthus anomalus]
MNHLISLSSITYGSIYGVSYIFLTPFYSFTYFDPLRVFTHFKVFDLRKSYFSLSYFSKIFNKSNSLFQINFLRPFARFTHQGRFCQLRSILYYKGLP